MIPEALIKFCTPTAKSLSQPPEKITWVSSNDGQVRDNMYSERKEWHVTSEFWNQVELGGLQLGYFNPPDTSLLLEIIVNHHVEKTTWPSALNFDRSRFVVCTVSQSRHSQNPSFNHWHTLMYAEGLLQNWGSSLFSHGSFYLSLLLLPAELFHQCEIFTLLLNLFILPTVPCNFYKFMHLQKLLP